MYETLEHWKQYKQEKDLQTKIAKEFKLNEAIKKANKKKNFEEFDKWLDELGKKNGYTEYVISNTK